VAHAEDLPLERVVLDLLEKRGAGKTICPSEAARSIDADNWRRLMQPVREAAARLAARGEIVATQRGKVVDARTARGPIRLRRA
jgi:hypothetical protein